MKLILRALFILIVLVPTALQAQEYQGFSSSNYAGVSGIFLQPASIVDMRYKVDINLIGFDMNMQNNYVGLRTKDLLNNYDSNKDFKKTYLYENVNSDNKYVYLKAMVQGLSVAFNINRKNSLALFTRGRVQVNADNITPELAKLAWEGLKYPALWNTNLNNPNLSVQAQAWMEYGFTYGREVFDNGKHYVKAAASFKLEQGLGSAYIYASDMKYNFKNNDTLSVFNSTVNYGHSTNFDIKSVDSLKYKFVSSPTIGFDMGIVYEWRPDYEKYIADKGKYEGKPRRDKNKYKLKVGFSLLDIGNLKFTKGDISGDFTANTNLHNIHNFKPQSVKDFNDSIKQIFGFSQTTGQSYRVNLPTAISFQVDYNIWRGFYANFTSYISFQPNTGAKLHDQTYFSLAPRFEHKWFDFGVPVSYNLNKQLQVGAYMRLGVLVIGTNNMLPFINDIAYGANVYAAVKIPIPYGKPRDLKVKKVKEKAVDTDGDGIPDDKDKCPSVAGPRENFGCPWPDTDGDGVLDKDDSCPTVKGAVENHGCPWPDTDGDGVLDKDDSCPKVKGAIDNHGCPWPDTDGDGVLDKDDSCPKVKGSVENHGCPWPDTDGDGVPDKDDKCPQTPGPASNQGCPVIEKKEQQILKKAFDNLEFVTGKDIIKPTSFPSLSTLAGLLKDKPDAKLIIAGHTDSTGTHERNMALSKARAEAVKNALMKRGAKADQLVVEYYGETKPIADNKTAAGRQKNRRVEMVMTYK